MAKRSKPSPNAVLYNKINDVEAALSVVYALVLIQEDPNEGAHTAKAVATPWRLGVVRCVSIDRWRRVFVHLAARVTGLTTFDALPDPKKLPTTPDDLDEVRWSKNQSDRVWLDPARVDLFVFPGDVRIPRGQASSNAQVASAPSIAEGSSEEGPTETSTPEVQAVTGCEAWPSCRECGYLVEANSAEYQVVKCGLCKGEFHGDCLLPFEKLPPPKCSHLMSQAAVTTVAAVSTEQPAEAVIGETVEVWACPLCRRCACCDVGLATALAQTSATRQYEAVLICQGCNLAAHGCCYYPRVPRLAPGTQWRCDECRKCESCEFETSLPDARTGEVDVGTWAYSYKQCQRCFQGQEKGEYCAVCLKAWSVNWGDELMVQCDHCQFWIHSKCDVVEAERVKQIQAAQVPGGQANVRYHCPLCRDVSEKSRILRVVDMLKAHDKQRYFTDQIHPQFLPIYQRVVKHPMFLSLMKEKVLKNEYADMHDFVKDFALIIANAKSFNMPNTPPYRAAEIFEKTGNNLIRKFIPLSSRSPPSTSVEGDRKKARVAKLKSADSGLADNDPEEAVRAIFGFESSAFLRAPFSLMPISMCGSLLSFLVPAVNHAVAGEWRASEWLLRDACSGCGGFENPSHPVEGCRLCGEAFHRGCAGLVTFGDAQISDSFVCRACTRCRFCRVYFADDRSEAAAWTTCRGCGEAWHGRCRPKGSTDYVLMDVDDAGEEVRRCLCERCAVVHGETRKTKQICACCGAPGPGLAWLSCTLCGKLSHSKCHKEWRASTVAEGQQTDMWGFDLCKECVEFTVKEFASDFADRPQPTKVVECVKKLQSSVARVREQNTLDKIFKTLTDANPTDPLSRDSASALLWALTQQRDLDELVPKDDYFEEDETNFVALCLDRRDLILPGLMRQMDEGKVVQGLRLFWRVMNGQVELDPDVPPTPPGSLSEGVVSQISPSPLWSFWRQRWSVGRFLAVGFRKLHEVSEVEPRLSSWPERLCQLCGCGSEKEVLLGPLLPLGVQRWLHGECVKWSLGYSASDFGTRPLQFLAPTLAPPSRVGNADLELLVPEWRAEVEKLVAASAHVTCAFCGNAGASVYSECGEVVAHLPCVLLKASRIDAASRVFAVESTDEVEADVVSRQCSIREQLRKIQNSGSLTLALPLVAVEEGELFEMIPAGAGLRSGGVTILCLGEWPGFSGSASVVPKGYAAVRVFWDASATSRAAGARKRARRAYLCRVGEDRECYIQLIDDSGQVAQLVGLGRTPEEAWYNMKRSLFPDLYAVMGDLSGNWFFGLETPVVAKKLKNRALAEFRAVASEKKPHWLRDFALRSVILNALGSVADRVETLRSWRSHCSDFARPLEVRLERLGLISEFQGERGDLLADDMTIQLGEWPAAVGAPVQTRMKASALSRALEGLPLAQQFRLRSGVADGEVLSVRSSLIHSNGLFARQNFRKGEMVVEYLGDLIRHSVADLREKKAIEDQEGADGSCYMFRLDEEFVVDATVRGNSARFINHSCQPNCICKVVECDERKRHIVIIAKHDIAKYEEITYDYQFAVESEKLICTCGAPSCLGRLN